MNLFLVMSGGALGAGARHLFGRWAIGQFGPAYPFGTLGVNLLGGLLMGLLVALLARAATTGDSLRLLLGTGVLGGFTTFSAFSLDLVTMIERGQVLGGIGYALLSVAGAAAALAGGMLIVRGLA